MAPPGKTATEEAPALRPLEEIKPEIIFGELKKGVLGQDPALSFVAVALFKHATGRVSGNFLLIGSSGTGKTTIMNNIQRLYDTVPEYRPFRVVTILNANLLVDSERTEFHGDRMLAAVEQRARVILGPEPTAEELKESIERATVCVDEIDKMTTMVLGRPNPIGVVMQQGLLTLMEGEVVPYRTFAWENGEEKKITLEINTRRMMFVCGGAFEGLYDQVYDRVTKRGGGQKLRSDTIRTADGQVRVQQRFSLADYLKLQDLFIFGMVPQFISRFDKLVLLEDLSIATLKEILLHSYDSPFIRSKRFLETLGIELELEDLAASLIAERAAKESRAGARALRDLFTEIINPYEFDPWGQGTLEDAGDGKQRLTIGAETVRKVLK
ncbi:MAG: AAA family ATPase [Acidobacteriota bacterium]|nr:AAA family ATPase [Acidobacteriota bacterium]